MIPGKSRRLNRLCRANDGRYLFVPMDHSVSDSPPELVGRFQYVARAAATAGADAVIAHKGRAAHLAADHVLGACGLVVHLSASTALSPAPNEKVLVGSVEDAIRLGADAASVHLNIGSKTEPHQLAALGRIASICDQYGMPLIAMTYARGPEIADTADPAALAHAANVAIDLGADIVKTALPARLEDVKRIVGACAGPVIFSGGSPDPLGPDIVDIAKAVVDHGAAGLAVGRWVWTDPAPGDVVRKLVAAIHPGLSSAGQLEGAST